MKKIIFITALVISCIAVNVADAQLRVNLNVNIGSQPAWGPVGYDHVDYYYMPDIDSYYYVPTHQYVYYENNVWVHRTYLPTRYRGYDVYNGYKVVINKPSPWLQHNYYHNTYATYRGKKGQSVIRDSRDVKYKEHWVKTKSKGHDKGHYDNGNHGGKGPQYHDNGNGPSKSHGNDDHGKHGDSDHGKHGGGHGKH